MGLYISQAAEVGRISNVASYLPAVNKFWGSPFSPDNLDQFSSCFQRHCLLAVSFKQSCLLLIPVHLFLRCGQHLEVFCVENRSWAIPSCLHAAVRQHKRAQNQFHFQVLTEARKAVRQRGQGSRSGSSKEAFVLLWEKGSRSRF